MQIAITIVTAIAAWFIAPQIDSAEQHARFVDFYVACASVIAALLIALAVEARSVSGSPLYAIVTAGSVAVGELSSIAALSPSLATWIYRWLFTFTVGFGMGALAATVDAGAILLKRDIQAAQDGLLDRLADRAEEDRQARNAQSAREAAEGE